MSPETTYCRRDPSRERNVLHTDCRSAARQKSHLLAAPPHSRHPHPERKYAGSRAWRVSLRLLRQFQMSRFRCEWWHAALCLRPIWSPPALRRETPTGRTVSSRARSADEGTSARRAFLPARESSPWPWQCSTHSQTHLAPIPGGLPRTGHPPCKSSSLRLAMLARRSRQRHRHTNARWSVLADAARSHPPIQSPNRRCPPPRAVSIRPLAAREYARTP